jgi:hypothetical protein
VPPPPTSPTSCARPSPGSSRASRPRRMA